MLEEVGDKYLIVLPLDQSLHWHFDILSSSMAALLVG